MSTVLFIIECAVAYAANRSYHSFDSINFLDGPERRRTRRNAKRNHKYEKTATDDAALPLQSFGYSERQEDGLHAPYDPYHGLETSENTLHASGSG